MSTLYHFTHRLHLDTILADGFLRPSESNIGGDPSHSPSGEHVGPDVVWLLDTPETGGHGHGLVTPQTQLAIALIGDEGADKTRVRFTLDVPGIRWNDWSWTARMDPKWRETMIRTAGGREASDHWYVFPGRIPAGRWVEVQDLKTGETFSIPEVVR